MCGICGIVDIKRQRPVDPALLKRMTDLMYHRGPDDEGTYTHKNMGMGVRRLSVIDLSGGHQPISNEDSSVFAIQNGEIYNFQELRHETESKGHIYKTKSDTEVIVHLYEEYGEEFVGKINGMFSIALWDTREEKLVLARDRVGIKPLFYYFDDHKFVFASEVKAIIKDLAIRRRINMKALNQYLTYGFVPAPLTMLEGIIKLLPGHMLIYQRGKLEIKQYWNINYAEPAEGPQDDYLAHFDEVMKNSIRRHLISDVPLGVFLSGGIDSSVIVAVASGLVKGPVDTFSITFDDEDHDESRFVRIVANRFKTNHHELRIKANAIGILPKLIQYMDEPVGDPCALATYHLSMFAKQYVTVALAGDGGDELFGGYDRYRRENFESMFSRIPIWLRGGALGLAKRFSRFQSKAGIIDRSVALSVGERYKLWMEIISEDGRRELRPQKDLSDIVQEYFSKCGAADSVNEMQYVDLKTYLPDDLLLKTDQMSMAHALEVRVPFLDEEVIRFAANLPQGMKLRGFNTAKYLLRSYLKQYLPKTVYGRGKHGFSLPVDSWFRGDLREFANQVLLDPETGRSGIFNREGIGKLLNRHQQGMNQGSGIWALIVFELWRRQYVKA